MFTSHSHQNYYPPYGKLELVNQSSMISKPNNYFYCLPDPAILLARQQPIGNPILKNKSTKNEESGEYFGFKMVDYSLVLFIIESI
jgi:hypothetical protein